MGGFFMSANFRRQFSFLNSFAFERNLLKQQVWVKKKNQVNTKSQLIKI